MEWFLITGVFLVAVALTASYVDILPLSLAVVYLGIGVALGPWMFDLVAVDLDADGGLVERLAEIAVVISLFGAGLRLRLPLRDPRWRVAVRLAVVSMVVTIGLIALLGWWLLGMSIGLAVLLGAVLAPTDPVLAAEVQVDDPWDRDRLRFGLTAEAGLNDGTAFPFVVLGLGLLELHDLGSRGIRWFGWDLVGTTIGGLVVGGVIATGLARLVLYVRLKHGHGVGLDGFLLLGAAALVYGSALLLHVSGFLAAFAAGLALRRVERASTGESNEPDSGPPVDDAAATDEDQAPAHLAHSLLHRNEQLERLGELGLVVLIGVLVGGVGITWTSVAVAIVVLLVIRPVAVALSLVGADIGRSQRRLTAWFGIRGVGSLYYLAFALNEGVAGGDADVLAGATLTTVAISIVIHGTSATPLLNRYRGRVEPLESRAG